MCVAETSLEAVEQLQTFFQADMWYSKGAEWKNEEDMLKYINEHFNICKKAIKKPEKQSEDLGRLGRLALLKKKARRKGNELIR